MSCVNTNTNRRVIWFSPDGDQINNKYDVWLQKINESYKLRVFDEGAWRDITSGGGSMPSIEIKPKQRQNVTQGTNSSDNNLEYLDVIDALYVNDSEIGNFRVVSPVKKDNDYFYLYTGGEWNKLDFSKVEYNNINNELIITNGNTVTTIRFQNSIDPTNPQQQVVLRKGQDGFADLYYSISDNDTIPAEWNQAVGNISIPYNKYVFVSCDPTDPNRPFIDWDIKNAVSQDQIDTYPYNGTHNHSNVRYFRMAQPTTAVASMAWKTNFQWSPLYSNGVWFSRNEKAQGQPITTGSHDEYVYDGNTDYGKAVVFEVKPKNGYSYQANITRGTVNIISYGNNKWMINDFSKMNADINIGINHIENRYYVSVEENYSSYGDAFIDLGQGNHQNSYYFTHGQQCTLKANPNDGYQFKYWTDASNNVLSYEDEYTFTVTKNITATCVFSQIEDSYIIADLSDFSGSSQYASLTNNTETLKGLILKLVGLQSRGTLSNQNDYQIFDIENAGNHEYKIHMKIRNGNSCTLENCSPITDGTAEYSISRWSVDNNVIDGQSINLKQGQNVRLYLQMALALTTGVLNITIQQQ